jgi:hypothetical protein
MKIHWIGREQDSEPTSPAEGSSLAVAQFMDLARHRRAVQPPVHPFRVETVVAEEHYCLSCIGIHWYDVARDAEHRMVWMRCRSCGKEGGG